MWFFLQPAWGIVSECGRAGVGLGTATGALAVMAGIGHLGCAVHWRDQQAQLSGCGSAVGWIITIAGYFTSRIRFVQIVRTVLILILFGLILPLVFELAWTGATLREWLDNVVLMPTARHVSPGQLVDPNLYLRPIFDFHHICW